MVDRDRRDVWWATPSDEAKQAEQVRETMTQTQLLRRRTRLLKKFLQ